MKNNLGRDRKSVPPALGLWPSCRGASCVSARKLLFLVLQQYLNLSQLPLPWTFGGFLEHMVEMAKRLLPALFSKYIHDCVLLLSRQRGTPRRHTGWRQTGVASCGWGTGSQQATPRPDSAAYTSAESLTPWPPCTVAKAEETSRRQSWR